DFIQYAAAGFSGVIITHSDGLDKIEWSTLNGMVGMNPLNFVRVAAHPEILQHLGKSVHLRVIQRYRNLPSTTLVGHLKGGKSRGQALVVPVSYDARSHLPDMAPGAPEALHLAIHLQLVRALADTGSELRRDILFVAV